jgi:hypothetical protein
MLAATALPPHASAELIVEVALLTSAAVRFAAAFAFLPAEKMSSIVEAAAALPSGFEFAPGAFAAAGAFPGPDCGVPLEASAAAGDVEGVAVVAAALAALPDPLAARASGLQPADLSPAPLTPFMCTEGLAASKGGDWARGRLGLWVTVACASDLAASVMQRRSACCGCVLRAVVRPMPCTIAHIAAPSPQPHVDPPPTATWTYDAAGRRAAAAVQASPVGCRALPEPLTVPKLTRAARQPLYGPSVSEGAHSCLWTSAAGPAAPAQLPGARQRPRWHRLVAYRPRQPAPLHATSVQPHGSSRPQLPAPPPPPPPPVLQRPGDLVDSDSASAQRLLADYLAGWAPQVAACSLRLSPRSSARALYQRLPLEHGRTGGAPRNASARDT